MKRITSSEIVQLQVELKSEKKAIILHMDVQVMRSLMRFSGRVKEILHMISLCYLQISLAGQTHFFLHVLRHTILLLFLSETVIPLTVGRAFFTRPFFSLIIASDISGHYAFCHALQV